MISKVNGWQSAGIGFYDLADFIIQDNTIWETPKDFKSENVYANPTIPPIEIKLLKYHKAKLMEETRDYDDRIVQPPFIQESRTLERNMPRPSLFVRLLTPRFYIGAPL